MLTIRPDQLQILCAVMLAQFEQRIVTHLRSEFPGQAGKMPEAELRDLIRQGVDSASKYRIETEAHVQHFLEFQFEIGPDFDTNPRTAWTQVILQREDLWPWEKLDEIKNHAVLGGVVSDVLVVNPSQ